MRIRFVVRARLLAETPRQSAHLAEYDRRHRKELQELKEEHVRETIQWQKLKAELERALRQLLSNASDAVELLPRGHHVRPEMRLVLTEGFSATQIRDWFGPSFSYYYLTHERPQPPNLDAVHLEAEYQLLDQYFERFPMASKHSYRVVTCTLGQFYDRYCEFHTEASPHTAALSYTSVRRYMGLFQWRFEKHPLFCPYCDSLRDLELRMDLSPEEQAKLPQLREHQLLLHQQRDSYYNTLAEIVRTQDATRIVAVQDFSTFFIDKEPIPVLIVVLYMYDPASTDHLSRFYRYILPTTDRTRQRRMSNNTAFVATAWDKLFEEDFVLSHTHWSRLDIFSDGGPKHFKTTAQLHYWCSVKARLGAGVTIRYTFFAPHHGESACDAASHHVQTVQHSNEALHGQFRVYEDFGRLEDPRAARQFFFIERLDDRYLVRFKPLRGIKQYYLLQFIDRSSLYAWRNSAQGAAAATRRVLPAQA